MRSKENLFRRAAKDDLQAQVAPSTGIQIAEIKDVKNKGEARRKMILATRENTVQSAKNPIIDNKEFFSSRKNFNPNQETTVETKKIPHAKKFQTESMID